MSSSRRRYGSYGRALTSPALLAASVAWQRPEPGRQIERLAAALPPLPPPDPSQRVDAVTTRRTSLRGAAEPSSLVSKYLSDSRERLHGWTASARQSGEAVASLVRRYCSPTSRMRDATLVRRDSEGERNNETIGSSLLEARLSGSDVRVRWEVKAMDAEEPQPKKTCVVSSGVPRMPVGGSSSRSGRLARISQSNIRPYGSGTHGGSILSLGGQPLAGPEPSSPTKKEFKHRFEIVKKLGSGTYGKVSLAFDHKFEREVAVKLIKKSAIENKADLVRIRREIRIMSALHHPNIIQIFEVFENKDKIILVMEYASGGELYDYVSKFGSLPESEARRIFRQITSAVLYCHKHKVAHRDLKLENILLDLDNNAKIADFGLSNYFHEKSLLSTFCGSPLYASPEIINGTPYRGPEVDCWSLGILLYTLVYGSMPFDGRDFNRMVRQIKRGAYYEPDAPSTASMLIRNMLRVNPDRRADIFDIASHWWLNLEENMPVIQELPENQITDHTPLTERAETMIVQDLADETDVFMEFGHLSSETRKKIEDFRRRRKEAEEYIDSCPVKPPKSRKTDDGPGEVEEMRTEEKSLRGYQEQKKEKESNDPLERLRQIENRLGKPTPDKTKNALGNVPTTAPAGKEIPPPFRPPTLKDDHVAGKKTVPEQPEDPRTARPEATSTPRTSIRAPSFVPVSDSSPPPSRRGSAASNRNNYQIETDSLNMLMNQVLEQMEKGPVSLNLVARIKAHPLYDSRPMVKELLESIIDAQPAAQSVVQQQTTKIIQQQSQEPVRKQSASKKEQPKKSARHAMGERPWHSVEVGFDPEESEMEGSIMDQSIVSTATEVTVQDTSFEDSDDAKEEVKKTPTGGIEDRMTQTEIVEPVSSEEEEEDEEYTDSEMEDLADGVEQVTARNHLVEKVPLPPAVVPVTSEALEAPPPPDPSTSPQYLDAFDRGLIKRQSKGKYQHSRVDMYGRGVSMECESPTAARKLLGGPQPTPEQSPYLFDKAKKLLMNYPGRPDPSELDDDPLKRRKKDWLTTSDDGKSGSDVTPTASCVGSLPPRTPPPLKSDDESSEESEDEELSEEESEEESDEEVENRRPRAPIIGAVRRDGDRVETTVTELNGRRTSYMQSAPASIHASMSPEPSKAATNAKYFVTVAELKMKPATTEPKPYSRVAIGGSAVENTKSTLEKKIAEREIQLKDELRETMAEAARSPSPEGGKDQWESAAAYIRRKNRERRFRNRTIGAPEEILRAADRSSGETNGDGRLSPISTDPFYSHHTGSSAVTSSLLNYVRPRFHEESYRRREYERPTSPTRINTAAVVREDRGKSYSIHDPSPDRPEYRPSAYAVGGDTRSYYSSNASPSYTRKFEHELQPTSLQSWATEPRKFEVYKTRAERDREMHTMHTTPTAASAYRPSSYYSSGSDRPLSSYSGYRREEPTRTTTETYRPEAYRTKYDDNFSYRRPYDTDRAVTPSSTDYTSSHLTHVTTDPNPSIRPTARRVVSALTEGDKRAYARSRSMDRKQAGGGTTHDYGAQIRSRLTGDSSAGDYSYVNYHDTSNGRSSQTREGTQPRSILKNKQTADGEPRLSASSGNDRGLDGGTGPVRAVIDRLRRHLSMEKSSSPQRQQQQTNNNNIITQQQQPPPPPTASGVRAPSVGAIPKEQPTNGTSREESPKKKRSLLSFNRRRTSEVRLGADGKLVTNGYDDAPYKRPSSPIDKIKSLFRKGEASPQSSMHSTDYYIPSRYTAGSSLADKPYTSSVYPTTQAGATRDTAPYVPQYRKYPGSANRDASSALNRYSYTPGLTEQRRHWYDDHNQY